MNNEMYFKIYFKIEDDELIKYTQMAQFGKDTFNREVIMNKETFIECYKKWIQEENINQESEKIPESENKDETDN